VVDLVDQLEQSKFLLAISILCSTNLFYNITIMNSMAVFIKCEMNSRLTDYESDAQRW